MTEAGITRSEMRAGRFRSWAATHAGTVRRRNEDGFLNRPDLRLWAVADGAGGHQAGDLASRAVIELLAGIPRGLTAGETLAQARLRLGEVHNALREEAGRRGPGAMLASTIVLLLASGDHFACLWAGDSRAYLLRDGAFTQVTRDHSLVQELVASGAITAAEAGAHPGANVITRAVGADSEALALDKVSDRLLAGDRFLLCSDGLCKTLPDERLAALLAAPDGLCPPDLLLSEALSHAAADNVTALVVEVGPEADGPA